MHRNIYFGVNGRCFDTNNLGYARKGNIYMEENQTLINEKSSAKQISEPEITADNSEITTQDSLDLKSVSKQEGEFSKENPSKDFILGKFKNVEELSKAYEELQKHQGQCSDELGSLRREMAAVNEFRQNIDKMNSIKNSLLSSIASAREKYNTPEYFQDPTFREIYKEALFALGENLDSEKLVNLLESYVTARIYAHDKKTAAENETQKVLNSMQYKENPKTSISKPKKSLDEMTEAEVDEMLDRIL